MVLELYTPTVEDSRVLTEMGYDGFRDDPVSAMMYSVPCAESTISASAKILANGWGKNPNEYFKCVKDSETGELLSYVQWFFVPERVGEVWKQFSGSTFPDDWDREFCWSVQEMGWKKKVDIMGTEPYICKSLRLS